MAEYGNGLAEESLLDSDPGHPELEDSAAGDEEPGLEEGEAAIEDPRGVGVHLGAAVAPVSLRYSEAPSQDARGLEGGEGEDRPPLAAAAAAVSRCRGAHTVIFSRRPARSREVDETGPGGGSVVLLQARFGEERDAERRGVGLGVSGSERSRGRSSLHGGWAGGDRGSSWGAGGLGGGHRPGFRTRGYRSAEAGEWRAGGRVIAARAGPGWEGGMRQKRAVSQTRLQRSAAGGGRPVSPGCQRLGKVGPARSPPRSACARSCFRSAPEMGPPLELEAIKARVREMEEEAEKLKELQNEVEKQMNLSPPPAGPVIMSIEEKMEADGRSIYVGNVDYGATAEELEAHFHGCGSVNRVTILCDKFTGHPKGREREWGLFLGQQPRGRRLWGPADAPTSREEQALTPARSDGLPERVPGLAFWGARGPWQKFAYIEFADKESVRTAMALDESLFRGRQIKVGAKRTNRPGISTTDRGFPRARFRSRGNFSTSRSRYYSGYTPPRGRGRAFRYASGAGCARRPWAGGHDGPSARTVLENLARAVWSPVPRGVQRGKRRPVGSSSLGGARGWINFHSAGEPRGGESHGTQPERRWRPVTQAVSRVRGQVMSLGWAGPWGG
ncbi:PAB2B protein, partial [Atractosteus spatula]|nr:PAB2B protein [Atractosteus spatula]